LEKGEYGILSGVTEAGEPYGIPLSYCVIGRYVYIHSALEGLLLKYSRNFYTEGKRYIEKLRDETRVFGISIDTVSGKA
jgi:hypothetical protein